MDEHAYRLIIYLYNYAYDFKKYERNDIFRTLYACYGYLSEFGDLEFVQPLIALMLVAYIERDLEMAARCAVLLGEAGKSPVASRYIQWAKDNGLIEVPQVIRDMFIRRIY